MDQSRRLVEAAKQGDRTAMQALLEQSLPGLRAFVRLRVDPQLRLKESSSDIVQSACREAVEHIDQFEYRGETSFRNWLYTTALNKIRGKQEFYGAEKRSPRREAMLGSGERLSQLLTGYATVCTPSQNAMAHEMVEQVEAAFDRLPEQFREVITLSRIIGLSAREIATELGKSEGAVRTQLSRGLALLSGLLAAGERETG